MLHFEKKAKVNPEKEVLSTKKQTFLLSKQSFKVLAGRTQKISS